jgi:hypothetical protein
MLVTVLGSIARRPLVEIENPSACATVNWKVCKSAIALYLSVIKRTCKQGANKSNHPNYAYHYTRDSRIVLIVGLCILAYTCVLLRGI